MDEARGEFGASWEAGSLHEDDAMLLKSPKAETPDKQDEEERILAMLTKKEMHIEQDLNVKSESTSDTLYSENLITNFRTVEWIKRETFEETSDLGNEASDDTVLLKSPKIEIPNKQDKKNEIIAMLTKKEMKTEEDLNVESYFLPKSESGTDTLHSENLHTNFKCETFVEISNLKNEATDDTVLLKSPKVEIPHKHEKETLAMLTKNIKSCFLANSESIADANYSENLVNNFKTLKQMTTETSEETPDLGNKASGADVAVFSTPTTLPRGGVSFTPDKTFICNDCGKQFDKKAQLIQHIKSHNTTSSGYIVCPECDYRTLTRDSFDRHSRLHDKTRPHQCAVCRYRYATRSHLLQHVRHRHSINREALKIHSCDVCDYKSSCLSKLKSHLRTHTREKPFSCSVCQYQCSRQTELKRHMRVHTGEKPFSCSTCGQKFSQIRHLERHLRTHTKEKPFSCSICTYTCSEKQYLNKHMRRHTGEKPFFCSMCKYKCSREYDLKKHMWIHTGNKLFSCSICVYTCPDKSHFETHMRSHTGEKPFSCSICVYTCSQKSNLKAHMRTHTGVKPFSCSLCAYTCSRKNYLTEHMRVHAGE